MAVETGGSGRGGADLVAWALDIAWPSFWLAECPPNSHSGHKIAILANETKLIMKII